MAPISSAWQTDWDEFFLPCQVGLDAQSQQMSWLGAIAVGGGEGGRKNKQSS